MKTLNEQTKKKTNEKKKSIEDRMSPIVETLPYKIYFFGKNTKQRIETHPALTFKKRKKKKKKPVPGIQIVKRSVIVVGGAIVASRH